MASTPTPVEAAPHAAPADLHTGTAAPEAHGSGGLPQFEFAHWGGQILYLLFLFVVLYILIAKVFGPRLRRVLDERAETISTAVATARSVQTEAADQAAAAKAEVEKARADSRATAAAAKARVAAEVQARHAAEEAAISARIAEAEAVIGKTRDAAMGNVSTIATDTARAMVERLTGQSVTAAEATAAVKGAA